MTRREFIKNMLRVAALTGIYPVLSYKDALGLGKGYLDGAEIFVTGCMWCQSGCTMLVYVRDGKVVHITGNPEDRATRGRICIKPFGTLEILNSPQRLKYPLKRVNGKLVRVSWEEALDEIADKLKRIRETYGGEALGIWASGRSAFDGRLINKAFAKLYGTPNWEKTGPFCNYSAKIAGDTTVGSRHVPWSYEEGDFYSADLYIFVGSNMAATRPVIFRNLFEEKKKRGCKFICIDPRCSQTARFSDVWIPIRPGTDMALALGMIHYILSKGLESKEFLKSHTEGFEWFKEELFKRGYTVDWAARVTGIKADDIKKLAEEYVRTPKAIIIGNSGLSHHTNAVQAHRVFYFLAAITGHFGYHSTGYGCLNNGGYKIGSIDLPKDAVPKMRESLSKNPAQWLESLESDKYPYQLKALISTGSPMTQWPNQTRMRELIPKLELSVWNGIVPSENIDYFHYILPAAVWIEAGTIAPVSDDSRFAFVPKLIDPPGEAKPDRWWWVELAKRMGWEKYIPEKFKNLEDLLDATCGKHGFSVKDFLAKKETHALRPSKLKTPLFKDGKFKTPSGKFQFYYDEKEFEKYGLTSFPEFYIDPDIAKEGEPTLEYDGLMRSPFQKNKCLTHRVKIVIKKTQQTEYPLNLITGRPSEAIMGDASHWSKLLSRISPYQYCIIHPKTAKKYGVEDGKKIRLVSPYGEADAIAIVRDGIREDTVFVPYSYGENDPYGGGWKTANFLTSTDHLCPISGQVAFKGTRVYIKT